MSKYSIDDLDRIVRSMLGDYRYNHSLAVAKLSKKLAKAHGLDEDKAYVAGLIHDITKEKNEDWQDNCLMRNNDLDKINMPRKTKHAYTAKYYAIENLNITDEEILDAVYNHTVLKSNVILSKIIYIADKREENRNLNDVIEKLKGIPCGFKRTSCPDQLARALEQYLK